MTPHPGLCATCRHAREVPAARSTFVMCQAAATDARLRRYPQLPVVRCFAYTPQGATPPIDGD